MNNTGKCRDCEFWIAPRDGQNGFGLCDGGIPERQSPDTLAYMDSYYDIFLHTKENFGCEMFAVKH